MGLKVALRIYVCSLWRNAVSLELFLALRYATHALRVHLTICFVDVTEARHVDLSIFGTSFLMHESSRTRLNFVVKILRSSNTLSRLPLALFKTRPTEGVHDTHVTFLIFTLLPGTYFYRVKPVGQKAVVYRVPRFVHFIFAQGEAAVPRTRETSLSHFEGCEI